jgi:hypothetical protein
MRSACRYRCQMTWGGRRILWGVAFLGALSFFAPSWNPWDLVASTTSLRPVALVIIPGYLWWVSNDLSHAWEGMAVLRIGSRRRWWIADLVSLGVAALVLTVGLTGAAVVAALVHGGWSWDWGPFVQSQHLPALRAYPPATWALEAVVLLSMGLWAMGAVLHVLALWWRSLWLPWVALMLPDLLAVTFPGTSAPVLTWGLPGPQFGLLVHFSLFGTVNPGWSIGYAVGLLGVAVWVGLRMTERYAWS